MNKFILLSTYGTDRDVYINVSNITRVTTNNHNDVYIYTTDGDFVIVNENIKEVMNLINN